MHLADEELLDELSVTTLPAYVLVAPNSTLRGENASASQVRDAVHATCRPVLKLDEDF